MTRFYSVTLVAVLVGLQFRLWVGEGSIAHVHRLRGDIERQQAANDQLKVRNARLISEVGSLKTNPAAIERRAREELGMIKPGESYYLLID